MSDGTHERSSARTRRRGGRAARVLLAVLGLLVGLVVAGAGTAGAAPAPQNGRIYFGSTVILPFFADIPPGGQIYSVNPDGSDLRQLTKSGGSRLTGSPEVSPDGTTIAYVTTRGGGDLALWLMDATGRRQREILSTPGTNYYSPTWAPDGQSLLLMSCATDLGELDCPIVSVAADGTGLTTLISNQRVNLSPSYSPDGTQIVYNSDKDGLRGAVYVTGEGSTTRLTEPALGGIFPNWAPDGQHVVLIDHCCQPHSSIYTVRPDGSDLTRVVRSPSTRESVTPAYSPGGDQVAYSVYPAGGGDADLVVAGADGRKPHVIVDSVDAYDASWAPQPGTGRLGPAPTVAPQIDVPTMASTPGAPGLSATPTTDGRILYTDTDRGVVVTANPDGSAPVEVAGTADAYADHAAWTPDASRIVVTIYPTDTFDRAQIFSVAPDGTDLRLLLAEPAGVYDYDPVVTPDGRWVVYSKYDQDSDRSGIWAVRLDGTGAHAVIPASGPSNVTFYGFHAVSPDGTKLAYEVRDGQGTTDVIWVGGFDPRRATLKGARGPITTPFQEAFPYSFSRDGNHVLGTHFNAHLGDGAYAFPVDGSTPLQIAQPSYPAQVFEPIQSPTGEKVAYIQEVEGYGGPRDLVIANRDGSDPQVVPTAADHPLHVQWSTAALQPTGASRRAAASGLAVSADRLKRLIASLPAPVRDSLRR